MIMRFLAHPYVGSILPTLALVWIAFSEIRRRRTA